jgi:hypothetical protein
VNTDWAWWQTFGLFNLKAYTLVAGLASWLGS